jgi:hypothetical protein
MGGPSSLARNGRDVSGTECMVSQPFCRWGIQSYTCCWVVTGDLRYLGYKTSTVVPEPSVERVAESGRSSDGKIDTHMILRVLTRGLEA